jgi:hypothetical protein
MGDDAAGANARKTALLDGQLPSNNPIGQPIQSSEKVVKVSGSYNALDQMILQELSCDSVMLVRETVFYVNDYQVDIRSSIGGDPLTIIPAKYLTTDTNCTGNTTTKIWKDNAGFYSDIASNKLSNSLQSWYNNYPLIIQSVKFTTATSAAATTTTPAATSTSQTYTNDKYGFNLTLPADWDKYKVKSTVVDGELNTYYFTLPTTDSTYAQATTTADAGYAAPFVIGVMNKSDWTGSEDQLRDFGDKIGENDKYVFTVSYWQAKPTDLSDSIATEAHAIVASFILAQ